MGNRISIQYQNGNDKSVVMFSHWQGMQFKDLVQEHYDKVVFPFYEKEGQRLPLSRMEPHTVMVDFIRYLSLQRKDINAPIDGDFYLARSVMEGDNSDNGHWVFDLFNNTWRHYA